MTMLDQARETLALDIYPVPVCPRSKNPTIKGWPELRLDVEQLPEHFSNGNNIGWLLGIEPLRIADTDLDCREAIEAARLIRGPQTQRVFGRRSKPSSHYLFELSTEFKGQGFKDPVIEKQKAKDRKQKSMLAEIRGKGQQTVVPPSVHETGEAIEWERKGEFGKATPEELRNWTAKVAAAALLSRYWPKSYGARMALGGTLARAEWTEEDGIEFVAAIIRIAMPGDRDSLRAAESETRSAFERIARDEQVIGLPTLEKELGEHGKIIVRSVVKWLGLKPERISAADFDEHLTDLGNAARLVRLHGADLRYSPQIGWLHWSSTHWAEDDTGEINRRAEATAISIHKEAAAEPNKQKRDALADWAIKSESGQRLREMIACARSKPGVPVRAAELDSDLWLFPVENGAINLRTGELRDHDKDDLVTKISPIVYDENAKCPQFEEFLDAIMCGKKELVDYLWRLMGCSLTGDTTEQFWHLFWGEGENGKSTLLKVWGAMLGPYAKHVDAAETFVQKRPGSIRNDLARLRGARLVTAIEVERQQKLAEAMVKAVTGEDPIVARFLYKELAEFLPTFKIVIAANHRPIIRGRDHAVWRRVRLVPFDYVVPSDKKIEGFAEDLKSELPGILNRAIAGCLDWQANGMQTPEQVTASVKKYREAMDYLKPFLEECCNADGIDEQWTSARELYAAYVDYFGEEKAASKKAFGGMLGERGFRSDKAPDGTRIWRGIELTEDCRADLKKEPAHPA